MKPFNFKTSERAKLTENQSGPDTPRVPQYEPLQQQLKNAFILRVDERSETSPEKSGPRKLTKAKSPEFETKKRLQLREIVQQENDFDSEHSTSTMGGQEFKAKPLNRKILERQSALPSVTKRETTSFTEFSLSQPNSKLGKRTMHEYLDEQERMSKASFKAQIIDKRVF